MAPRYFAARVSPAYHLRHSWTGWPTAGEFPALTEDFWEALSPAWRGDGLHLLERRCLPDRMHLLFSATPDVTPVFLAARAKGRLQHAMRRAGTDFAGFSRKTAVRSIGKNRIDDVEAYILNQVSKEECADREFRGLLTEFTVTDPSVDLSAPRATRSGRYWYNLHLVLIVDRRQRVADEAMLAALRDGCLEIAKQGHHAVSVASVLPDHLHAAIRGNVGCSPEEIALGFQNGLADRAGCALWADHYYVGTFGAYDMEAVRRNARAARGWSAG